MLSNKHMQVTFLLSVQRERERGWLLPQATDHGAYAQILLPCLSRAVRTISFSLSVEAKTDLFQVHLSVGFMRDVGSLSLGTILASRLQSRLAKELSLA